MSARAGKIVGLVLALSGCSGSVGTEDVYQPPAGQMIVSTMSEAQTLAPYRLRRPTFVPLGALLRKVERSPTATPDAPFTVRLSYERGITFSQSSSSAVKLENMDHGRLIQFRGRTAWIRDAFDSAVEGSARHHPAAMYWYEDGVLFKIFADVPADLVTRMAESVQ